MTRTEKNQTKYTQFIPLKTGSEEDKMYVDHAPALKVKRLFS